MKIFGTSFSLVLGAWRLRLAIDLEDETFVAPSAPHHVRVAPAPRTRERTLER
jgi:hypothetical protein